MPLKTEPPPPPPPIEPEVRTEYVTIEPDVAPRAPDLNNIFERPYGVAAPMLAQDAKPRRLKTKRDIVLRPVHPNAGIEAEYRRKLYALVEEMHRSFGYKIKAAYRKNEPVMALDATPAAELQRAIEQLARRWRSRFDQGAEDLADFFAKRAYRRTNDELMAILKRAGFTVEFKMTPAMRDIFRATVEANVQMIKSIPEQYLTQVQGSVMRSVQVGRDLRTLTKDLEENFGVTRRRAALIAKTQNNMATAAMTHARQEELGITKAIWLHSHAGREPRPTHLANDGKKYDVAEGWFDPDPKVRRRIWPGELINCRCVSKPIIKGFS